MPVFSNTKGKRESFSVSRFIVLPGLLRISAEFLLLSTGPLSYLTQLNRTAWRVWLQRLTTIWLLFWEIGKTSGTIVLQRFRWSLHFLWNLCRIAESTANTGISLCMSENSDSEGRWFESSRAYHDKLTGYTKGVVCQLLYIIAENLCTAVISLRYFYL